MANIFGKLFSGRDGRLAAEAQKAALREGETKAVGAIDQGVGAGTGYLQDALAGYEPYAAGGGAAYGMYNDALGLGGQGGRDRAQSAFQAGPGYQWALGQGEQGLLRNAASRGMLGSGNLSADLMGYNQGMADQQWQGWLGNLGKSGLMGLTAAQGQGGANQSMANLAMQGGLGKAGIYQQTGQGIGQAAVNGQMAGQNASANAWGAALGVGNLAASLFGGGSGGGGTGMMGSGGGGPGANTSQTGNMMALASKFFGA